MNRRGRNPYKQGSIAEFYKIFFKPLRRFKPENMSGAYWDDEIFAMEGREIGQFEVLEDLSIPGNLVGAISIISKSLPEYRKVKKGQRVFIRTEEGQSYVDIENPVDADGFERVFRADVSTLGWLKGKLRAVKK